MKKDNIIFLDIDGPLLPARQWYSESNASILRAAKNDISKIINNFELKKRIQFDPVAVNMFNTWQYLADAKYVLATNWVQHTSIPELIELFLLNGLNITLHFEPLTPKKFTSRRMDEIYFWLDNNQETINNFIVVDDDYSLKPDRLKYLGDPFEELANHVVYVDYDNGITIKNFKHGCAQLGIKEQHAEQYLFGQQ